MISFFELITATALNEDLSYALCFLCYSISITWALILWNTGKLAQFANDWFGLSGGDTFRWLDSLRRFGHETWFQIGDRDLKELTDFVVPKDL